MNSICFVGTGYVGLVTGACLADFGNDVACIDNDKARIELLKSGKVPFYEPGLDDYIKRNQAAGRLSFTVDSRWAMSTAEIIFIAVGTPSAESGEADLSSVYAVARDIAEYCDSDKIVVLKSTVPVGTCSAISAFIKAKIAEQGKSIRIEVVSNPEFLREGTAIYDFTHPDKVVIGTDSEFARDALKDVYRVLFLNETPFVFVNRETSELIKYANNAFLAMKISFINEISRLCENVGANVQDVSRAIGKDGRIGPKFLHAGPGFGGSCFPKDTRALAFFGRSRGVPLSLVEATMTANELQKGSMIEKIANVLHPIEGKTVALLGLTFKPNTDDVRESPALDIIRGLLDRGAKVSAYDPMGIENAGKVLSATGLTYCRDEYGTMIGASALVITTEWHQFRNLDLSGAMASMKDPVLFDLRNTCDKDAAIALGFRYFGVGV